MAPKFAQSPPEITDESRVLIENKFHLEIPYQREFERVCWAWKNTKDKQFTNKFFFPPHPKFDLPSIVADTYVRDDDTWIPVNSNPFSPLPSKSYPVNARGDYCFGPHAQMRYKIFSPIPFQHSFFE